MEISMNCPKCAATMEKVEFKGVEVDRCSECHGLWFDLLEHEQLKKMEGSEAIDTGAPQVGKINDNITRIECPVCHVPLIGMVVIDQAHIRYESCTVCYGAYFDAGEFSDFKEQTLRETLRAVFAGSRTSA